ncbi:MAG: single-stranded DNA-binding protein [Oscillospiraceae bacterium]|jgi:single-stranded DNA-binding protein|nr:single-stranded DNA-binding protein [Oscillospiraceae bacterium]
MAQLQALGLVITDPELKTSVKGNPYVRFTFAERVGKRETARQQHYQVWAWGDQAAQLEKAGVKKNSYLWVNGSMELVDFVRKDGVTHDKQLKLMLTDWSFVYPQSGKARRQPAQAPLSATSGVAEVINGDRENLPE